MCQLQPPCPSAHNNLLHICFSSALQAPRSFEGPPLVLGKSLLSGEMWSGSSFGGGCPVPLALLSLSVPLCSSRFFPPTAPFLADQTGINPPVVAGQEPPEPLQQGWGRDGELPLPRGCWPCRAVFGAARLNFRQGLFTPLQGAPWALSWGLPCPAQSGLWPQHTREWGHTGAGTGSTGAGLLPACLSLGGHWTLQEQHCWESWDLDIKVQRCESVWGCLCTP